MPSQQHRQWRNYAVSLSEDGKTLAIWEDGVALPPHLTCELIVEAITKARAAEECWQVGMALDFRRTREELEQLKQQCSRIADELHYQKRVTHHKNELLQEAVGLIQGWQKFIEDAATPEFWEVYKILGGSPWKQAQSLLLSQPNDEE